MNNGFQQMWAEIKHLWNHALLNGNTNVFNGSSQGNAPLYPCYTLDTLMNLVCHVWWAIQYFALWVTNKTLQYFSSDAEWECLDK